MKFTYSNKPYNIYCIFDPAIDLDKTDIKEYAKTRDENLLVFKPDKKPVKFVLKNIPNLLLNNILSQEHYKSSLIIFGYAIERIENFQEWILTEDVEFNGSQLIYEPDNIVKVDGKDIKYIDPEDVLRGFSQPVIAEIATIALKKTQSLRGMKPDYPILPISIGLIGK